jgi:type IV pilus assembly protein PilC
VAKTYAYKAKDRTGQALSGTLIAESETAAAAYVRNQGYYITQLKEERRQWQLQEFLASLTPVKGKDLAVFCRQFATMMDAGLSMIACLNILIVQTYSSRLKTALQQVLKKVQEGETLSRALEGHPAVFPEMMISMIGAGEVGGVLDVVLNRLAIHFEKEHKLNEKVKSAMTYPIVVICMAGLSLTFILTFVLPTFVQMFDSMKVELPWLTRMLLEFSRFLREYAFVLVPVAVLKIIGAKMLLAKPEVRKKVDPLLLKLPVFGMLSRKIAIARFSRTLSTLVRGGVPIISALEVVKKTTANTAMIQALSSSQESIKEGLGLSSPLGASQIFTPMVVQMVAVGEETGELDKMLDKVADFYESDVDDMVSRLSSMLEPILIGVMGVVIGIIIISVVLPMFDVITNFSGKV